MTNNRIMKIIGNTVGLAAVAALGITVYQLGTAPVKDEVQEEKILPVEENEKNITVDAGTKKVEADMKKKGNIRTVERPKAEESDEQEDTRDMEKEEVQEEDAEDVSALVYNLPEVNFSEDTLMEWPVNGNILVDYSMDQTTYFPTLDQYRLSPAIAVQAVEGAPVMAAVNGKVLSVEQSSMTGNTVTMELGNGYQAIYGQLTDLQVAEGDIIKKGTIIGYIGEPTKYYSKEGNNLYFAMKQNGEPIDPIAYLP